MAEMVLRAQKALLVHEELPAHLVHKDLRDQEAMMVQRVQRDLKVQKVHVDLKVLPVQHVVATVATTQDVTVDVKEVIVRHQPEQV